MPIDFTKIDDKIELNEKRYEFEMNRYQQIVSKVSYTTIFYSVLLYSINPIMEFVFNSSGALFYILIIFFTVFILLLSTSAWYTLLLIRPRAIAHKSLPKNFYTEISKRWAETENPQGLSLNERIQTTYLHELEQSVATVKKSADTKSGFYEKAIKYAVYSLPPYVLCFLLFFFMKKETPQQFNLCNYEAVSNYIDSLNSKNDSPTIIFVSIDSMGQPKFKMEEKQGH